MTPDQFIERLKAKDNFDYGLCPPPVSAEEGLDVIIKHFLGSEWCSSMSMSSEQVYTEAIYQILEQNQPKNSWTNNIRHLPIFQTFLNKPSN